MKVNIFGVGRSGTKALALYISYLIAKRENMVWLNYEPYTWAKKGVVSFKGVSFNIHSNQICSKEDILSDKHSSYIKSLIRKEKECSVVTKFIKACGRIEQINQIIKPNFTILVFRDLYQVLESLKKFDWNLFSVKKGHRDYDTYENLIYSAIKNEILDLKDFEMLQSHFGSNCIILKNALYWYLSNKAMLRHKEQEKTHIIQYDKIDDIDNLLSLYNEELLINNLKISNKIFSGENLNSNYPLKWGKNKYLYDFESIIDRNLSGKVWKNKSGALVSINDGIHNEIKKEKKKPKDCHVERCSVLDYMNDRIFKMANQ